MHEIIASNEKYLTNSSMFNFTYTEGIIKSTDLFRVSAGKSTVYHNS